MTALVGVMVDGYDDGTPGQVAFCEEVPEFVGHGDDECEALLDWLAQFQARVLH
jgi:hypothetical protein